MFREHWEASGREWPGEVSLDQRRVPSDVEPLENSTLPVKRRRSWSYEACIEALAKLLDETDGKPLTERLTCHSRQRSAGYAERLDD